jgi:hypothetical protein
MAELTAAFHHQVSHVFAHPLTRARAENGARFALSPSRRGAAADPSSRAGGGEGRGRATRKRCATEGEGEGEALTLILIQSINRDKRALTWRN